MAQGQLEPRTCQTMGSRPQSRIDFGQRIVGLGLFYFPESLKRSIAVLVSDVIFFRWVLSFSSRGPCSLCNPNLILFTVV